jgi:cytochrome c biogenesis protein CcmG/thiol:disulfide interchange protein DsbE
VALLAYGLFTQGASTRIDDSLANGEAPPAPGFALEVLEAGQPPVGLRRELRSSLVDGELAVNELRGIPFVLNFWASWCAPCREEAPVLQRGWERHGPKGILYLGLNMQDVSDDARAFLEEFRITYPTIREPDKDIATAYGAIGIPETYFVSGEGEVVAHVIGVVSDEQLDAGVRAARAGEVVGLLTGGASRPQR